MKEEVFIVYKSRSKTNKTGIVFIIMALIAYALTTSIQFAAIFGFIAIIYFVLGLRNDKILKLDSVGVYCKNTLIANWQNFLDVKLEEKNYSAGEANYVTHYLIVEYFDQKKATNVSMQIEVDNSLDKTPDIILDTVKRYHQQFRS